MPHENLNFTHPRNVVVVSNQEWKDDDVTDISVNSDLTAGDEEVMAAVESTTPNVLLGIRAIGTTTHTSDIDSDGANESIVRYHYQVKIEKGDEWNSLPGLARDIPLGGIGSPLGLVGGSYIGPMAGFRIKFENRSDESGYSATSVSWETMGAVIHARVLRHGTAQLATPVVPVKESDQ